MTVWPKPKPKPKPLRGPGRSTGGSLRAKALETQGGPDRHGDAGAPDEDERAVSLRAMDEPHSGSCRPPRSNHECRRGAAVCPGQEPALLHDVPLRAERLLPAASPRTGRGTGCRPSLKGQGGRTAPALTGAPGRPWTVRGEPALTDDAAPPRPAGTFGIPGAGPAARPRRARSASAGAAALLCCADPGPLTIRALSLAAPPAGRLSADRTGARGVRGEEGGACARPGA